MSGMVSTLGAAHVSARVDNGSNPWVRRGLITLALAFLALLILLPLCAVFATAFREGLDVYFAALADAETFSAIRLTLITSLIAVPLNTAFGIAAAWLISKYHFPGKSLLVTLIDVPFSVSPVVAGLIFVLLLGARGWFGPWLSEMDIRIIFAVPGVIIATAFVTVPMVAREVLTTMQSQGNDEEEAALTMGASGFQILRRVTLPKVKWAVLYGVILCNARAMGEFGAVSVVSGHVRGETNTLPLHVEVLYGEYHFVAAFAVASLLAFLAIVTLVLKVFIESLVAKQAHADGPGLKRHL
jgi:sulfate/thiosulfate transport system permease protein